MGTQENTVQEGRLESKKTDSSSMCLLHGQPGAGPSTLVSSQHKSCLQDTEERFTKTLSDVGEMDVGAHDHHYSKLDHAYTRCSP